MAAGDTDDEHDDVPYRAPLPKDDRLWRHPSELEDGARHPFWWRRRRRGDEDPSAN